jgi:hypothetical protein
MLSGRLLHKVVARTVSHYRKVRRGGQDRRRRSALFVSAHFDDPVFLTHASEANYQRRFVAGRREVECSTNHREERHGCPVSGGMNWIVPVREVTIEVGLD